MIAHQLVRRVSRTVLQVLVVLAGLASLYGCPDGGSSGGGTGGGSQPVITLTAADCAKDKIKIDAKVTKSQQGGKWRTRLEVTVTCDGQPINAAEFKVEVSGGWWTAKFQTDAQGKFTATGPAKDGDPAGQTVTVTVKGSDGETQKPVTIT